MRKTLILLLAATLIAGPAAAQLRLPVVGQRQPATPPVPLIDLLRAEFAAQSGGTTVYFGGNSSVLGPPARTVLAAQAAWLRRHPEVVVRVEGYADPGDTRDHALAIGARRAEEVRNYLILLGVPAAQIGATTWGKERPGPGRAVTVLVR
ncbi:MAG TPA: OmpA family protein [Sphingomicrobium sp.]|nr:OmpA family protein [Sphingomicrobium sp.]